MDRQYEKNNNCELDNGVYNKFCDSDEESKENIELDPFAHSTSSSEFTAPPTPHRPEKSGSIERCSDKKKEKEEENNLWTKEREREKQSTGVEENNSSPSVLTRFNNIKKSQEGGTPTTQNSRVPILKTATTSYVALSSAQTLVIGINTH